MTSPRTTARADARPDLRVARVTTAAQARAWVDVPARLYAGQPGYVPPLRADALKEMHWRTNPFHRHAHTAHFLLRDGSGVIGRVAATVHPAYNERHGRRDVFFGFLDAPPDPAALEPLLAACAEFGTEFGAQSIAGPYNYWSGSEFGLLINNFDQPPAIFQTWNLPGMREALESLGLAVRTRTSAFEIDHRELGPRRADLLGAADAVTASTGITTRAFRPRHHREDGEIIRRLNTQAFAASAEVLPYPPDVFDHMLGQMRPLLDPSLIRIAVRGNEPVGFGLTVPDIHQLLLRWNGRMSAADYLRLPRDRRRIDAAVVLLLGVQPGTPMGVAHLLFADTLRALEQGPYNTVHTTWVHEDNSAMRTLLGSALKLPTTRDWVVLAKDLT